MDGSVVIPPPSHMFLGLHACVLTLPHGLLFLVASWLVKRLFKREKYDEAALLSTVLFWVIVVVICVRVFAIFSGLVNMFSMRGVIVGSLILFMLLRSK